MSITINVNLDDSISETNETGFKIFPLSVNELYTVSDVKNIYKKFNNMEIQFIYRSEIMADSLTLKEIGIKEGSFIQIMIRKSQPKFQISNVECSISEIIKKLEEILKTRPKDVINKIILEEMSNITETNPELKTDLIAYSIAFDYRLLRTLFSSPENVTRILEKHPVLIPAAMKTINAIHEKVKKLARSTNRRHPENDSHHFSLQGVEQSDNSSSEEEGEEVPSTQSSSFIPTTSQQSTENSYAPAGRNAPERISLAQLRNAVQTVLTNQSEPMEVDEPIPDRSAARSGEAADSLEEKLNKLQSMGFLNRKANIAALEAAGGNVETAIEFLII